MRDSLSAIEVLLMKKMEDGAICFVNGAYSNVLLNGSELPDLEMGKKIARERLKLPYVFCYNAKVRNRTIDELEERNIKELSVWQKCPWLDGELILLLDQDNKTELNGYILSYSMEQGLRYARKDE